MSGHCFGTHHNMKKMSDKSSIMPFPNEMDAKLDCQFLLMSLEVMSIKRHLDVR